MRPGRLDPGSVLVVADPNPRDAREQKRYLRAVEARPQQRDKAIGYLLFYSGLRIAELTGLDVDDVPLPARKGSGIVRNGKGQTLRQVPLTEPVVRDALATWKRQRADWPGAYTTALLLNRRGGRLSARSVDQLLDELAEDAGLVDDDGRPAISAHVLRATPRHQPAAQRRRHRRGRRVPRPCPARHHPAVRPAHRLRPRGRRREAP